MTKIGPQDRPRPAVKLLATTEIRLGEGVPGVDRTVKKKEKNPSPPPRYSHNDDFKCGFLKLF